MASRREQVVDALFQMLKAALPNAKVRRNVKKPTSVDPGGTVIVYDGDPGEPEVTMSPLAYTYDHQVFVDVAAYPTATDDASGLLDRLLGDIGAAIRADRTLGGVCEFLEAKAPAPADAEVTGAEPVRWAELTLVCTYTTNDPLA